MGFWQSGIGGIQSTRKTRVMTVPGRGPPATALTNWDRLEPGVRSRRSLEPQGGAHTGASERRDGCT